MNKKIKLQVFLYALLALLIPFFAWSRGEEIKVERKLPVAKYVAKGGVGELSNQNTIHEKELITPTELTSVHRLFSSMARDILHLPAVRHGDSLTTRSV